MAAISDDDQGGIDEQLAQIRERQTELAQFQLRQLAVAKEARLNASPVVLIGKMMLGFCVLLGVSISVGTLL
jgi:hypothetical protein